MKESETVLEWINEGRVEGRIEGQLEGRRETLLTILADKFGSITPDLAASIQQATDLDLLRRWASAAARAATLVEFRAAAGI